MYAALMFMAGWVWYYLIVRQVVFNLTTAKPLIKKFRTEKSLDGEPLMNINAQRFLIISIVVWMLLVLGTGALVTWLCRKHSYLYISFFIGGLIGFFTFIGRYGPSISRNFRDFCAAYYRFVPADNLREAMYYGKVPAIKAQLENLGVPGESVIPEFKD